MVPPAFTPSAFGTSPKFDWGGFLPTLILMSNLGEAGGGLGVRCNGRSRFPYSKFYLLLREQRGEGDFTVCPVVSHLPTTF